MTRDGGSSWNVCKGKFALSSYKGPWKTLALRRGTVGCRGRAARARLGGGMEERRHQRKRQAWELNLPGRALAPSPITSSSPPSLRPCPLSSTLHLPLYPPACPLLPRLQLLTAPNVARRKHRLSVPTRPDPGDPGDGHMTVPTVPSPSPSQSYVWPSMDSSPSPLPFPPLGRWPTSPVSSFPRVGVYRSLLPPHLLVRTQALQEHNSVSGCLLILSQYPATQGRLLHPGNCR